MAKPLSEFEKAFAEARKIGAGSFEYKGKSYNTKYKEEVAAKKPAAKPTPIPEESERAGAKYQGRVAGRPMPRLPTPEEEAIEPSYPIETAASLLAAPGMAARGAYGAARGAEKVGEVAAKARQAKDAATAARVTRTPAQVASRAKERETIGKANEAVKAFRKAEGEAATANMGTREGLQGVRAQGRARARDVEKGYDARRASDMESGYKRGGMVKGCKGDGLARKGKTKGRMV